MHTALIADRTSSFPKIFRIVGLNLYALFLLSSLVWLFAGNSLVAAPAFVQVSSKTPQTPQTTVAVTFPAAQSAQDLNVVIVGWNDTSANVISVVDSNKNAYQLAFGPTLF